jgi:tetratricopeptide (TPR) repeat protein
MAGGRTITPSGDLGQRRHVRRAVRTALAIALGLFTADIAAQAGLASRISESIVTPANAAPLDATVTVDVSGGFARLVFSASQFIDAQARLAGNVLIVNFRQPLNVSVERLPMDAPDYIGAARRDPDGSAVRIGLAQNVRLNAIPAGDKYFVDLLPASWTGLPPGLPQAVVDELARRAREADQMAARERQRAEREKHAAIRVHAATQPTFTRYVFEVPDEISVSADRNKNRLLISFDKPITFDLADAAAALPPMLEEITSEIDQDKAFVRFMLAGRVDVRTFRDESGYVVDIINPDQGASHGAFMPPVDPSALAPLPPMPLPHLTAAPEAGPANPAAPKPDLPPQAVPPQAVAPQAMASPQTMTSPQLVTPPAIAAPATVAPAMVAPAMAMPTAAPPSAPPPAARAEALPPVLAASAPVPVAPGPVAAPAAKPAPEAPAVPALPQAAATPAVPAPGPAVAGTGSGKLAVELARQGDKLTLSIPFPTQVAAAVFRRADMLWLVFDTTVDLDLSALDADHGRTIRSYDVIHASDAEVLRLKLDRPQLSSVAADGNMWTIEVGDTASGPATALGIVRTQAGLNHASISIAYDNPQKLHAFVDPESGDALLVVTGLAPARGLVNEQDFIEFKAPASVQGVVIEPIADDINVELAKDRVTVGRPSGLTLSSALQTLLHGSGLRPVMFDSQAWGFDREASFAERQSQLVDAAAGAPESKRLTPRLDLARFYLARGLYPEAKGVLDVALRDDHASAEATSALVLRAAAEVMMDRPDMALKDLADPSVGDQHDAPLWRAIAFAAQGRWTAARAAFKSVEAAMATLPVELQRVALRDDMRSAIEVGDFDAANAQLNDFETIGVPHSMEPAIAVLMGRLAEGMGRTEDALSAYRTAADSWDRPAAAQGLLRETALRYRINDLKRDDVIAQLESLTTIWRGDETEIEALKLLAHLYTEDGRYRDAFYVMRSAMAAHPNSEMTRQIQDEAATTFDSIFLSDKGDALPPLDAMALFYDFRELTPIGSRGDEMIRRLADRLVSMDLLNQASDLLQYQVDHRLQGAARAQVAAHLAIVYLMDRKADRAIAALRASRSANLSNELRTERLLLEGRALSDTGRYDLALEVVADLDGPEVLRLRSDILWAAKRWSQSAEQVELMYGDRYKEFRPLTELERQDIMRAEIGYALADDTLGLARFREKYAAKMADTPDGPTFELVSKPLGTSSTEFGAIAHAAAAFDTLDAFLRAIRARFPEAAPSMAAPKDTAPTDSGPSAVREAPSPILPPKASGRTAQL